FYFILLFHHYVHHFVYIYHAPTLLYPLSLHDALPIYARAAEAAAVGVPDPHRGRLGHAERDHEAQRGNVDRDLVRGRLQLPQPRSEEHTSELQSRENLVCRLLLEKKKIY